MMSGLLNTRKPNQVLRKLKTSEYYNILVKCIDYTNVSRIFARNEKLGIFFFYKKTTIPSFKLLYYLYYYRLIIKILSINWSV